MPVRLQSFEKSLIVALETLRRNPGNRLRRRKPEAILLIITTSLDVIRKPWKRARRLCCWQRFPNDDLFYVRMALSYQIGDKRSFKKYRVLFRKMFRDDNWNKLPEKLA